MSPTERKELAIEIALILQPTATALSDEEARWVKMAIQREAQSIELRKAIIEKTFAGLVWAAILSVGYVFVGYLRSRGLNL